HGLAFDQHRGRPCLARHGLPPDLPAPAPIDHVDPAPSRVPGQPTLTASGFALSDLAPPSSAARAASQSRLNWTMPLSVSGWWTICWKTLNGSVAIWEPAIAASTTCRGWRTEAVRTSESYS